MVAQMTTPTGQHHVGDTSHYLTSGKNLIAYLILNILLKKLGFGESPYVSYQLLDVNSDGHHILQSKY